MSNIIIKYVRQYKVTGIIYAVMLFIFQIILILYDGNLEAVNYATILSLLVGIVAVAVHFGYFMTRHKKLVRAAECATIIGRELPPPSGQIAADYQVIISRILADYDADRARWKAERADMIDYYSTWVHQIKTPIAALRMQLQLGDTDANRVLLTELFHIEQYVEMVLCYIRLDSESSDLSFSWCSLDAVIRGVIRSYAGEFISRRLSLTYEKVERQVLTDEKWLAFVIGQILSNAVKYTREGGITVCMPEEDILEIRDTGIGIAPEDIPRIFEKGYTGFNGREDKKATGLGLYLSKRAMDMLQHGIRVESEPGRGTSVYLDLRRPT